jgi:hypothetical protein
MFSCSGTILSSVCIKSLSALRYDVYCVLFLILSYLPTSQLLVNSTYAAIMKEQLLQDSWSGLLCISS